MPEELPSLPSAEEFFDLAPSGFLVTSLSGLILKANRTFCTWLGLSSEELVQKRNLQEFFTMGARIFHQTHWLPMLEMQGSLSEVKFDLRNASGQTFPVLLNAIRRTTEEGLYDLISVVSAKERNQYERELLLARNRADGLLAKEREAQTALRISQARLQQAMQLGAVFFWDVDLAVRRRRFGDEVALLLGFNEPRPIDADAFLAAIDPRDLAAEQARLAEALKSGESYHSTFRLNGRDSVQRVVTSSARGFLDEQGALVEFVGTLVDVTEIHRLRESAEDRALFAEQMVGIVSHDLRNPLQTVTLSAQVIARDGAAKSEKTARMLSNIDSAGKRAQRLISDLLDFTAARLGRGLAVKRRSVDIHDAVARVVEELALAFPDRALEHRAIGPGETTADVDRIAQLIGNLVGNAMSYGKRTRRSRSPLRWWTKTSKSPFTISETQSRWSNRLRSSTPWCEARGSIARFAASVSAFLSFVPSPRPMTETSRSSPTGSVAPPSRSHSLASRVCHAFSRLSGYGTVGIRPTKK
jgi:sigma-B regulation protein RsbU (phosphoserine phosphatase)